MLADFQMFAGWHARGGLAELSEEHNKVGELGLLCSISATTS